VKAESWLEAYAGNRPDKVPEARMELQAVSSSGGGALSRAGLRAGRWVRKNIKRKNA